ncbi:hypothetical protein [Borreliella valaisiana]|uniref:hypothetical protein n=1 Tax=Borreliella valaisiana TaxID=62088 RepID=UPI0004175F88|nr:hypothetical protein [Borreliella valaisiana]
MPLNSKENLPTLLLLITENYKFSKIVWEDFQIVLRNKYTAFLLKKNAKRFLLDLEKI